MEPSVLSIGACQASDGLVIIGCAGEVDTSSVGELAEALAWSMTADLRTLRVDATEVEFFDSSGVHCLLEAARYCRDLEVRFEVAASRQVARTLGICGLPGVVDRPVA